MRKICLTNYIRPNKSSVYLDHRLYSVGFRNSVLCFKSEKLVQEFLSRLNIFLNETAMEINKYNAELYTIYRTIYNSIEFQSPEQKKIRSEFVQAEDIFQRVYHNTGGIYGNSLVFNFLSNLIDCHLNIAEVLNQELFRIREDSTRQLLKGIKNRLNYLQYCLDMWPDHKA